MQEVLQEKPIVQVYGKYFYGFYYSTQAYV